MMGKQKQHTLLGVLCLLLTVVPAVGIMVNRAAERRLPADTNGHTLAMVGGVLALWVTVLWIPVASCGIWYLAFRLGWVTIAH